MSLSKEFSEILEPHRVVLTLRKELVQIRKQQFELWVIKARRMDMEEVAKLIEDDVVRYFESEVVALDFLLGQIDELMKHGFQTVGQWEAEAGRKNG